MTFRQLLQGVLLAGVCCNISQAHLEVAGPAADSSDSSADQTCAPDSFVAYCTLRPDEQSASFWTGGQVNENGQSLWQKCVPRVCGDYPVENGFARGLPAKPGQGITVACNPGFAAFVNSPTVLCRDDCTWSHKVKCEPRICPFSFLKNSFSLPVQAGKYGETRLVQCLTGYRSSRATQVPFNQPCSTVLEAYCSENGEWILNGICEPVQCPIFDANDESLQCVDPDCKERNLVATMTPPGSPIPYLGIVTKQCKAGYEIKDRIGGSAQCGAQCQYTMNHGNCAPKKCENFSPQLGATSSTTSAPYRGEIELQCDPGRAIKRASPKVEWGNCESSKKLTCDMVTPVEVATGTLLVEGDQVSLRVTGFGSAGPVASARQAIYNKDAGTFMKLTAGMIIEIGGVERTIVDGGQPTLITDPADWPQKGSNGQVLITGASFKIKSQFSTSDGMGLTQADLTCEPPPLPFKCGVYSLKVGTYSPEDPNTKDSGPPVSQGEATTLKCKDGYRVVPIECLYAYVELDTDQYPSEVNCTVTKEFAEIGAGSYKTTCTGCKYVNADGKRCAPYTCRLSLEDGEENADGSSKVSGAIPFGEKKTVMCKRGFLAGNVEPPSRGLAVGRFPRSYTQTCGTLDTETWNDWDFSGDPDPGPCTRVMCGVAPIIPYASVILDESTFLDENPEWSTTLQMVHEEKLVFQCNSGYRRSDRQSSYESPCNATITVTCDDGQWKYDDGSPNGPTCVEMQCGQTRVCGNETCNALMDLGVGVDMSATSDSPLNNAETQTVFCAEGYRAQPKDSASNPTCDAPSNYSRTCGWCSFSDSPTCKKITCMAELPVDANGVVDKNAVLFEESMLVTCNAGYRASSISVQVPPPDSMAPRTYSAVCGSSCAPDSQGKTCRQVSCPVKSIVNTDILTVDDKVYADKSVLHGTTIKYRCKAGFKRKGTVSTFTTPCSAFIFAVCNDGAFKYLASNITGLSNEEASVEAACEPITGCGRNSVCGSESCTPHKITDPNAIVPAPSQATLNAVIVTCNAGFAPAPADDSFSNCAVMSTMIPDFSPPPSYDETTPNMYKIQCNYCNWEAQVMSCKPLACTWKPELEPNGNLISIISDSKKRILKGVSITIECKFGWRATSSNNAESSDPQSYTMGCSPGNCNALRDVDVPVQEAGMACKSVACQTDALNVPNAKMSSDDGNPSSLPCGAGNGGDDETNQTAGNDVVHDDFVKFECLPGFKSVFATTCTSSDQSLYGRCTDGKLIFFANKDKDPVMRGPAIMDKSEVCLPKTCPRLDPALHPFTKGLKGSGRISDPSNTSQDAWNLTVNCLAGHRVGPDPVLPDAARNYSLICEDCSWKPCIDMYGYTDSEGDSCKDWTANPTWCYGSPEDGVLDLPALYANADGIDPAMACCVCGGGGSTAPTNNCQAGYCPHVHFDDPTKYVALEGVLQDGVFVSIEELNASPRGYILEGENIEQDITEPILLKTLQHGQSAEVTCKPGFRIKGKNAAVSGLVTCTDTGLYPADLQGICVPLICDSFPEVPNSDNMQCVSDEVSEQVKTCEAKCGVITEDWKCKDMQCLVACYPPCYCQTKADVAAWISELKSIDCPLVCSGKENWQYGTDVTVTCNPGYIIYGGSCHDSTPLMSKNTTCNGEGKWTSPPQCVENAITKDCKFKDPNALTVFPGDTIEASDGSKEVKCKPGFVAAASPEEAVNGSLSTKYFISCADCMVTRQPASGDTIAPETPDTLTELIRCLPVACPPKNWSTEDPNIATWSPGWPQPINAKETVLITCKKGFRAYRQPTPMPFAPESYAETCMLAEFLNEGDSLDASYSSSGVQCQPVTCERPPLNNLWDDGTKTNYSLMEMENNYQVGDQFTYSCQVGFRIKGTDNCQRQWIANCMESGYFNLPECVPVACDLDPSSPGLIQTPDIPGGQIPYNSRVKYGCDFGYKEKPNTTGIEGICGFDCQITSHLECMKIECIVPRETLAGPDLNASALVEKAQVAETIPIMCAEGFVFAGNFFDGKCISTFYSQCLFDGKLTLLDELNCVQAACPDPRVVFAGKENTLVGNAVLTFEEEVMSDDGSAGRSCAQTRALSLVDSVPSEVRSLMESSSEIRSLEDSSSGAMDTTEGRREGDSVVLPPGARSWGEKVKVRCNPGYVVPDGTCITDGTCKTEFFIQCGNGADDGQACEWKTPPRSVLSAGGCIQKNLCRNFEEWDGSNVILRVGRSRVEGTCPQGKQSLTRNAGSCSQKWVAECLWHGESGEWNWFYKKSTGQLVKHCETDPCAEALKCTLPKGLGTKYLPQDLFAKGDTNGDGCIREDEWSNLPDVFNSSGYASDFDQASGDDDCVEARDLAALRDLDAVELGKAASILCDRSFQGSGSTYTCTETCEFSPPVQTCSRIICPDLKGSAAGFDFTTASVGSIKAQYAPSDAVRIQCPADHMLKLRPKDPENFVIEGLDIPVKVLASSSFPAPPLDVSSTYIIEGAPGYGISFPAGAWPKGESRPMKLTVLDAQELSASLKKDLDALGDAKLMGNGVYFEPSGIIFSKPVEIAIPFDTSINQGDLELSVHRWSKTGFEKIKSSTARANPIDMKSGILYGETLSFSLYGPVLTRPLKETPKAIVTSTPVPSKEIPSEKLLSTGVIIAIALGGAAALLLIVVIYFRCCRGKKKEAQPEDVEQAPAIENGAKPHAQRGISRDASKDAAQATRDLPETLEVQPAKEESANGKQREALSISARSPMNQIADPVPPILATPKLSEPTNKFSFRQAPELPPPDEVAPMLRTESPQRRRAQRTAPASLSPMTPPAQADISQRERSPLDAFSIEDISCLLPPGWLCCVQCRQPVNATWHKCPKCGTPPSSGPVSG